MASLLISHVIGVLCAFVLHRRFVFRVRGHVWLDLARFWSVNLAALGVNAVLLPLFVELAGLPVILAQSWPVVLSCRDLLRPPDVLVPTSDNQGTVDSEPRVSVVIPTFNNESYVEETMSSVLAQTFTDFELVVADHSSADRTWELLQQFTDDPRVRLLTTPAGGGAERNWNRVTAEATGELVKLVCGDDLLAPDMLETQVAAFDEHDDGVVMVASSRDIVDASGRTVVHDLGLGGLRGRVPGRRGDPPFGAARREHLRRAVLRAVPSYGARGGGSGGTATPGYMIDQATYCRVLLQGDLVDYPGPLAAFRVSASQWSVKLAKEQATSAAEMHRQLREMAPGLLSSARRHGRQRNGGDCVQPSAACSTSTWAAG